MLPPSLIYKKDTVNTLTLAAWLSQVEQDIETAVSNCTPREWNEDHISYSWLHAVTRNLRDVRITDVHLPFAVAWDAYKVDGALEEKHGDIAFLVRLTFPQGKTTSGVGFLEAKRVYPNGDYGAIKWEQLDYQASRTANHKVLLYDDQTIPAAAENLIAQGFCLRCYPKPFHKVKASVVQTHHVIALHCRNRDLNSLSIPLSYQICCRYLRGFDLDYERALVQAVESGVVAGIRYLFVAHAVIGTDKMPSTSEITINHQHFRPISADEY